MTDGLELALPTRRTWRGWAMDTVLFCAALFLGLVALAAVSSQGAPERWAVQLEPVLGLTACCALWGRRRFPFAVAVVGLPAAALAASALPACAVILTGLATRRRWQQSLPVFCGYLVAMVPSGRLLQGSWDDLWIDTIFSLGYLLTTFACGSALRSRRLLVQRLRLDAVRAAAEHERRLADARRGERQAIAREMHDVLAHRISLLSVHAGALAYRTRQAEAGHGPALSGAEVAESAEVIRGNAHEAVQELQEVLHLLRADGGDEPASLLPRIEDIGGLVDDARATGQPVDFRADVPGDAVRDLRSALHRTAYRVAQEGLTNARKHAPGTPVSVLLAGRPGAALTVEVRNPLHAAAAAGAPIPGTGAGLTGLAERVRLDGGTLDHTATGGMFTLRARLPWPAR
ncbi:sensor histidine kinase [Streptomyces sp. NPDC020917]|uniref:sensor histidine kinase n=1 Tax=Streptomyces sp. NPDC020917 TaxID=3365102 RepID=UPI0037AC1B33